MATICLGRSLTQFSMLLTNKSGQLPLVTLMIYVSTGNLLLDLASLAGCTIRSGMEDQECWEKLTNNLLLAIRMSEEVSANNKLILSIIVQNDTFDQMFAKWGSHRDDNGTMTNDGGTIGDLYFSADGQAGHLFIESLFYEAR
uniref:Uncharacterized protein n=1 Tax=Romanomermis culicivorax TaxID=13658 RepID=A0A915HFU8_ROMCU